MSAMSLREKAIFGSLGVVVIYAVLIVFWFLTLDRKLGWCPKSWGDAIRGYEKACKTYRDERRMIADRDQWRQAYEDEKAAMPTFEEGKATDTTWQRKVEEIAKRNHISITQSQTGHEIVAGDVLELEIDVRNWEGALESLVRFMHELENTDDGMFDVKSLNFKPSSKRGYLRGSFTLTCAYMRES